jgi:hypothetical protein
VTLPSPRLASVDAFRSVIRSLRTDQWIDVATRAVFVEMTLFNANENLFMLATMVIPSPDRAPPPRVAAHRTSGHACTDD